MPIPTLLEADVLLMARDDFQKPSTRKAMGITATSSAEQITKAERKYVFAALRAAYQEKTWPQNQPKLLSEGSDFPATPLARFTK
jgi:hypothetical protein